MLVTLVGFERFWIPFLESKHTLSSSWLHSERQNPFISLLQILAFYWYWMGNWKLYSKRQIHSSKDGVVQATIKCKQCWKVEKISRFSLLSESLMWKPKEEPYRCSIWKSSHRRQSLYIDLKCTIINERKKTPFELNYLL